MWEGDIEEVNSDANDNSKSHRRRIFGENSRAKYMHGSLKTQIQLTASIAETGSTTDDAGSMLPCIIAIACFMLLCYATVGHNVFIR